MVFSVLIPVYNAEKTLSRCIQSVLNQTFSDYEIVLCDDGSQDSSPTICDQFADRFSAIRCIHKPNEGLLLTRRLLFREAKGTWILCLDADDELRTDTMEVLFSAIESGAQPDLILYNIMCTHGNGTVEIFRPSLSPNQPYSGAKKKDIYEQIYANYYLNSLCSKAIRKTIIDIEDDYLQYAQLSIGEDLFQSYPIFDAARVILYIDEDLYIYVKNSSGMTTTKDHYIDLYRQRLLLWVRQDFYNKKWHIDADIVEKIAETRLNFICSYLLSLRTSAAREEWLSAVRTIYQDNVVLLERKKIKDKRRIRVRYQLIIDFLLKKQWDLLYKYLGLLSFTARLLLRT